MEILPFSHQTMRLSTMVHYGDWMTTRIKQVLDGRFQHRNQDGSVFRPRIASAHTFCAPYPIYHIVEIDSQGLWHFKHDQLIDKDTLTAMALHVGRPVRYLTSLPSSAPGTPARSGLAYVVSLIDLRAEAQPLPKRAELLLEHLPRGGDYNVPIGVGAEGGVWRRLPQLGHLLVAGTTGAGKSNWLQAMLAALVAGHGADRLQLVLIDPKAVEFSYWSGILHLFQPVATDLAAATAAAEALADEVNRRLGLFLQVKPPARDLDTYNRRAGKSLPRIVVVVDEFLDLAEEGGKNSQLYRLLIRQANRARAAGVTFVLAATSPKAEVMNTSLRNACTTRIAFRCTESGQSRVILEAGGAETIPAGLPGRFMARLPDADGLSRFQAYHIGDELLQQVTAGAVKVEADQVEAQSALSQAEAELVRYAITHLEGSFAVRKVWEAFRDRGWSHHQVRQLATQWERKGWLTVPTHVNDARRITNELLRLVEGGAQDA